MVNKRGEISTLVVLGALAVVAVAALINSTVTNNKNITNTKASGISCKNNPEAPPDGGYTWVANCASTCTVNSDCPQNTADSGNVNPVTSNWCYGFAEGAKCLQLQKGSGGESTSVNSGGTTGTSKTGTSTTPQTPAGGVCDKSDGCGGGCNGSFNSGCGYGGCRRWEQCVNNTCIDTTSLGTSPASADACNDKAQAGAAGNTVPTTKPDGETPTPSSNTSSTTTGSTTTGSSASTGSTTTSGSKKKTATKTPSPIYKQLIDEYPSTRTPTQVSKLVAGSFTISPNSGTAGTAVKFSGTGWPKTTTTAYINLKRVENEKVIEITVANVTINEGNLSGTFSYPSDPIWKKPGNIHVYMVTTMYGLISSSSPFTVNESGSATAAPTPGINKNPTPTPIRITTQNDTYMKSCFQNGTWVAISGCIIENGLESFNSLFNK